MPVIRCLIRAGYLEPPPRSKCKIGPRSISCYGEGFPEKSDWFVAMLPYHTVFTKNTPDKVLARCFELYPEAKDRERRVVSSLENLPDVLAGIQVYYGHIDWWPAYCKELANPSEYARGFEPAFEVEVPDEPTAPITAQKRIIIG
jgi:hypothetical protein